MENRLAIDVWYYGLSVGVLPVYNLKLIDYFWLEERSFESSVI